MIEHPSASRVTVASLAAAGAAAAPTILLGPAAVLALPIGFIIAGLHMLVIGLPTYLVLRSFWRIDWAQAIVAGALIGSVPITFWAWLTSGASAGWIFGGWIWALAALGALAGAAFRAVIGAPGGRIGDREAASIFE